MKVFGLNIERAARPQGKAVVDPSALPTSPTSSDITQRMVPTVPSEYYQLLPKITPQQIRMLLLSGMQGNFSWWYDLTSIMQDTSPRLLKDLHEVRDACRNTKFIARAYAEEGEEPTDTAQEKAAFIDRCLKSFEPVPGGDERNFSGTIYNMSGAIVSPQVQEIIWRRGDKGEWLPRATAWVHSRRLGLMQNGRLGIQPVIDQDISYTSLSQNKAPQDLPANKFIYSIYPTRDGAMTMSGLLRPLAWWWGGMMYGRDWLLVHAQLFGQPFRWATYRAGLPELDKAQLDAMMANWGSSGYGIFQDGTTVNTVKGEGVGQENPQRFLIDHFDEYCDLLIKGESLSDKSSSNPGQMRGNSATSHKVRNQRIEGMCSWLSDDLTDQLIRPIMLLNYGRTDEMPRMVADFSEPQTGLELAQTASIWLTSYDMDAHEAAEISGLPLIKKEAPAALASVNGNGFVKPNGSNGNGKPADDTVQAMLRAVAASPTHAEKVQRATVQAFTAKLAQANAPLTRRLQQLETIKDDGEWKASLRAVMLDFPELAKQCLKATKPAADVLAVSMGESMKLGLQRKGETVGAQGKRF